MVDKTKSNFLSYLHSFRGFAIISVVAGHAVCAIYLAVFHKYDWSDPILIINEIMFNHSTLYFALLSGLLFSSVLKDKSYNQFYTSKVMYVFLPYLFFTLLYSYVKFHRYNFIYVNTSDIDYFLNNFLQNLILGTANFVLWYMPVLFGLYLLTPLFSFLLRHKKHTYILIWIIILAPLLSASFKMPFLYGGMISKIIYYSGAYVLGMYLGVNIEASMKWLEEYFFQIVFVALTSSVIFGYLGSNDINVFKGFFLQEALYYMQKICFSAIAIVLLNKLGKRQPVWLIKIASHSTPIYFIHGAVVFSCSSLFLFMNGDMLYDPLNIFLGAFLLLICTIALCMLISVSVKKVFGAFSRMIIGA